MILSSTNFPQLLHKAGLYIEKSASRQKQLFKRSLVKMHIARFVNYCSLILIPSRSFTFARLESGSGKSLLDYWSI